MSFNHAAVAFRRLLNMLFVLLDRLLAASGWSLGLFALNRGVKKNPPMVEKLDYDPTARYAVSCNGLWKSIIGIMMYIH
jgi:hypothetical protein